MRTDRLLHLGVGLLALSLLLAIVLASATFPPDTTERIALTMIGWVGNVAMVVGGGCLVGHLVVRALTDEPSFEDEISDWFE